MADLSLASSGNKRTKDNFALTRLIAAIFRYKSRRIASAFWRWRFHRPPSPPPTASFKQPLPSVKDDPEVKALMDKYKLLGQVERFNVQLTEVDENCDAEDEEETISN